MADKSPMNAHRIEGCDISVVIPTYNGANRILPVLSALEGQMFLNFEVILAIDGSTDDTKERVLESNLLSDRLTILESTNIGRGKIRNLGAKQAKSRFLLFIDDDIILAPNALDQAFKAFSDNIEVDYLVGKCMFNAPAPLSIIDDYRKRLEERNLASYEGLTAVSYSRILFTSALLAVRASSYWEITGFNESLNDSEDFDLCMRALIADQKIFFCSSILADHMDSRTIDQYIDRKVQYWIARDELGSLKSEYVKLSPDQFIDYELPCFKRVLLPLFQYRGLWKRFFDSGLAASLPFSVVHSLLDKVLYCTIYVRRRKFL